MAQNSSATGLRGTTHVSFVCQRCFQPLRLDQSLKSLDEDTLRELTAPLPSEEAISLDDNTKSTNSNLLPDGNKSNETEHPPNVSAARSISQEGNGFTLLGEASSVTKADNLSHRLKVSAKLFDIMSNQSEVDHPLCEECTDALLNQLDEQLHIAEKELHSYKHFLEDIEKVQESEENEEELDVELEQLKKQESDLLCQLESIENEREKIRLENERLDVAEQKLKEEEEKYGRDYCQHKKTLSDFQDEQIRHKGHFGTINGFRLGRLPSVPKIGLTFKRYRLVPYGNHSYIECLEEKMKELPIYGSGGFRFFWDTKFDQAMVAFLDCLQQFKEEVERGDSGFYLPYRMEKGKIFDSRGTGSFSVKIQFNSEEHWTKALKFMLTNLKWGLAWVSSQFADKSNFCFIHCLDGGSELNSQKTFKRLGEHKEPSIITEQLDYVPQPIEFYEEYVSKKRPVVFRGAAMNSRAFTLWTEDFLQTNYGDMRVRLEAKGEDDGRIPAGKIGLGHDLLSNFIDHYQTYNAYIITQLSEPMEKDVAIPPCLRCGFFAKSIQEAHLFLSAAGGKTALHKDPYNNIHCVFNGTKDWITIHPDQTGKLYMAQQSQYEWGGISDINVDAVDLDLHPNVLDLKFSKIKLSKGDCIFMPSGYWHQVRSWGYLNAAVSIWFSTTNSFNRSECYSERYDFKPMNEVDVLWRYPGFGNMTQGHMDIYILQEVLKHWANKDGNISLHSFVEHFFVLMEYNQDNKAMIRDMESRKELFLKYLDRDSSGYTTTQAIDNLNTSQLKDLVELIHPNDISNTDVFEYGHINPEHIRQIFINSFHEDETFDEAKFLETYVQVLGGTAEKGNEILDSLKLSVGDEITMEEYVLGNLDLDNALHRYMNAITHDPATEKRIYQFLMKFRSNGRKHDEL
eukprot:gene17487-19236_t